jgi:protein-tyrosine-phosphatase
LKISIEVMAVNSYNAGMGYLLFVCTHNAGCSQMAQTLFERHAPADIRAESAGQEPGRAGGSEVVEAMREIGVELGERRPLRAERCKPLERVAVG